MFLLSLSTPLNDCTFCKSFEDFNNNDNNNNQKFYKYLGVEENKVIGHMETKEKLSKEYFSRLRKIPKSELNSYNMIMSIYQWAVPAIIYKFGTMNWAKTELLDIDRKTRTLLNVKCGKIISGT